MELRDMNNLIPTDQLHFKRLFSLKKVVYQRGIGFGEGKVDDIKFEYKSEL